MTARNYANQSTPAALSAPIGPSDGTITVTSLVGYPAVPYTAVIEKDLAGEEVVLVTGVAGLVLTVTRGYDGTVAQSHAAATLLTHVVTALDYREANVHNNGTSGSHGLAVGVNLVGDTTTQTLTNKTLRLSNMEVNANGGTAVKAQSTVGVTGYLFRGNNSVADVFTVTEAGNTAAAGTLNVTGTATAGGVVTDTVTGVGSRWNLAEANVGKLQSPDGLTAVVTLGATSAFGAVAATTIAGSGAATFATTVGVTGAVSAASVAASGAVTGATVTASGAATAGSVTTAGAVSAATLASSGAATVGTTLAVTGATTLAAATATALTVSGQDVLKLPKGIVGYADRLTSQPLVTAATVITGLSAAIPATTDLRKYKVTFLNCGFYCDAIPTAGGFQLGIDGANVGLIRPLQFVAAGVSDTNCPTWYVTPTIAAHTFTVYIGRSAGVGQVGVIADSTNKMEILVEDMGRV